MVAVITISGGIDSITALYQSAEKFQTVVGVSFDYGSKHNNREIPYAQYHCQKLNVRHQVINLEFVDKFFKSDLLKSGGRIPKGHYQQANMKSTVVPFRNGIMFAISCGYAESINADVVVIGSHRGDHAIYPDCRVEFNHAMSDAMKLGTYRGIQLDAPFEHLNKAEIAKLGEGLGIDFSKTWSCYNGQELHCGKCGTCVERIEAFKLARVKDNTQYENKD